MTELNFVVIGAQKSGTTTLHEILKGHPQIALPADKEAPYFNLPSTSKAGWEKLVAEQISTRAAGRLVGKCSPQYLATPGVAEKVHALFPQACVIAILREPVDRTLSHYRMCSRRAQTDLSLEESVDAWLRAEALNEARALPMADDTEAACCVVWSEYGRQLQSWIDLFGYNHVHVLYLSDLETRPEEVIAELLCRIGADPSWQSDKIGQTFFKGSTRTRMSVFRQLKKVKPVVALWSWSIKHAPARLKYRFQQWNEAGGLEEEGRQSVDAAIRRRLASHFASDLQLLRAQGFQPPWG